MKTPHLPIIPIASPPRRHRHAFSLVEVTLALGIVTFGLVGVVGVLPTALSAGRQSFDQNRAAAIANTLLSSFRSQSFGSECYVDEQFSSDGTTPSGNGPTPINFNLAPSSGGPGTVTFYAKFLSLASDTGNAADTFGTQRRLLFSASQPPGGADYQVALNFYDARPVTTTTTQNGATTQTTTTIPPSNVPDGMVTTGQACRVEIVINSITRPGDQYHFVSTVANRNN